MSISGQKGIWRVGGWLLLTAVFSFVCISGSGPCYGESLLGDSEEEYYLQPGDSVKIDIFPADDYIKGGRMEVSSEGNVTIPLVGKIPVAGKTAVEAEREIAEILGRDYLVNPEVTIAVKRYVSRAFVVLGSVKKPGTYTFPEGATRFTLLQAISLAGGFSDVANIKKIKVMRKKTGDVIRANAENIIKGKDPDVELTVDDVIHVSESLF
jgi:polysaccharide export outer membrane protein